MRAAFLLRLAAIMILAVDSQALAQALPARASIQVVNATSVPSITLRINDTIAYENFPQGLKTADSPSTLLTAVYEAEDRRTGSRAKSAKITYEPGTNQSLVILGDFSTDTPPGALRHPGRALTGEDKQYPPNVLFQVFSHAGTEDPVRLRIINGMPGKSLTFVAARREIAVKPGEFALLAGEPATARYLARVDGENIPLLMRQEGLIRNAMVIFFLKSGRPAFVRAFENNADSNRRRGELEKEGQ
jgi:hypothetical protein